MKHFQPSKAMAFLASAKWYRHTRYHLRIMAKRNSQREMERTTAAAKV